MTAMDFGLKMPSSWEARLATVISPFNGFLVKKSKYYTETGVRVTKSMTKRPVYVTWAHETHSRQCDPFMRIQHINNVPESPGIVKLGRKEIFEAAFVAARLSASFCRKKEKNRPAMTGTGRTISIDHARNG